MLVVVLLVVPMLQNLYYSFFTWDGISAPVLSGLNDSRVQLEGLLRRARNAGAAFAAVAPLTMPSEARAKMVRFVAYFDPEKATRYDRLLARSVEADPRFAPRLQELFAEVCDRLGVAHPREPREVAPVAEVAPRQLSLF